MRSADLTTDRASRRGDAARVIALRCSGGRSVRIPRFRVRSQMARQGRSGQPSESAAPSRVVIEGVRPEIDCGRFPIKRTVGEEVVVSADIFAEGHDVLARRRPAPPGRRAGLGRGADDRRWSTTAGPAASSVDGAGAARVHGPGLGRPLRLLASRDLRKKAEAGQDVASELLEGAEHVREGAARADGARRRLAPRPRPRSSAASGDQAARVARGARPRAGRSGWPAIPTGARGHDLRPDPGDHGRARAGPLTAPGTRCSPARARPSRAGTARFSDVEARLPYVARHGLRRPLPAADPPDRPEPSARGRTTP